MKTRLIVLVTLFMMLFCGSAFADVSGGSITRLRNTNDGQKIVIFTQEGYSVASVQEFVANKPMEERNVIEERTLSTSHKAPLPVLHTAPQPS